MYRSNDALQQELEKLIAELAAVPSGHGADGAHHNVALRDEIVDFAAHVVAVTAKKEGETSPLHAILQQEDHASGQQIASDRSLASRIHRLIKN